MIKHSDAHLREFLNDYAPPDIRRYVFISARDHLYTIFMQNLHNKCFKFSPYITIQESDNSPLKNASTKLHYVSFYPKLEIIGNCDNKTIINFKIILEGMHEFGNSLSLRFSHETGRIDFHEEQNAFESVQDTYNSIFGLELGKNEQDKLISLMFIAIILSTKEKTKYSLKYLLKKNRNNNTLIKNENGEWIHRFTNNKREKVLSTETINKMTYALNRLSFDIMNNLTNTWYSNTRVHEVNRHFSHLMEYLYALSVPRSS